MAENLVLASLPKAERKRLEPFITWVKMDFQQVLIEPDQPITDLYFPFDAVTSTVQEMEDGSSIESGLMGIEGLVGIQLWLRMPTTPTRTFVQVDGRGQHISAEDFKREIMDKPESPLNVLISKYIHAFLTMTSIFRSILSFR